MAYYSEDLIEEVISQNDIIEVISEYVNLKKSGRNFMGLCPFHREKTSSFCVSMDKQIFKCFGCSEGGNVISFIRKIENLDFWDSVELLAERAQISLEKYQVNNGYHKEDSKQKKEQKEILYQINKEVAMYYHNNLISLLNSDHENEVKDYIKKRKFDQKTIKRFGIGYANGTVPLYDYLVQKGYQKEEILRTGILLENAKGKIYDRFYSRLMFPIIDVRDRVIAFGGRVLDQSLPKYVNSPENEIYFKSRNLYGMNVVKKEKIDNMIVVEGYMDAIALQKSGFTNAVASLGTALTDGQARLIKKYTDHVILGYDQDQAGQEATMRGMDILAKRKLDVKVLLLDKPDAKDADEYLNKYGPERLENCIKNSVSCIEYKIARLEKSLDENNMDSKIRFLTSVADVIAGIENSIERELYIDKVARKYHMGSGSILKEVEKRIKKVENDGIVIDMQSMNRKMQLVTNIRKRQEQYIIALILTKNKAIQDVIFEKISLEEIQDEKVKEAYQFLRNLKEKMDLNQVDILTKIQDDELMKEFAEIMYIDISTMDLNKLLSDVLKNKNKEKLYLRRDEIIHRLNEEITSDEKEVLKLELNQIVLKLSKMK